jgi:PAS domain S-box-containing protein
MKQRNESRIAWPVSILLFELAFLLAHSFDMASAEDAAARFWFSHAVLLSALLLSRPKEWWVYVLVTFPIRFFLFVPQGTPLWFLFACFTTDSLQGLLSAWLLRHPSRVRSWFDELHEFRRYFLIAVVLAPGLSAFAGAASATVLGHSFWASYMTWFFGGALASLILAPFILLVVNYKRAVRERRFGPVGAAGSLLLMSVLSIVGTRFGRGPFYLQSHEASLISMQVFLFFASVPFMFLSVITDQQRRKLTESEERLRSLIDVAPVMLWMSGADARCTFFNKTWLDFTGLSPKEQAEQDWVARIHPEDRERCVNTYLSAFKSRENFSFEYRMLRNDGVYRWVVHKGLPRYAADGAFLGYIGSRADFTDRREAEEHLRKVATQLLNAHESERSRIGYELHEDLAQTLCALSIDLSRFSDECDGNGGLGAAFDKLQRQLRKLSKDAVRLSHQLRPATVEGLALSAALRNLCQEATDDKRPVLFVEDEELPALPLDVSLPLYRIAQDALQNAFSHSGATYIQVELSTAATTVRLSVRDNGCGFVVGSNTKPGLGLSRMSERMRSSGGVFSVISNPGERTVVAATMPLAQSMKVSSTA